MDATFSTNGVHHPTDADLDTLYAWVAQPQPPVQPSVEPCFSVTLRGLLGGVDALLTVRGQTAEAFKANLEAIKGLLDAPVAPAAGPTQGQEGYCGKHGVNMKLNRGKDG